MCMSFAFRTVPIDSDFFFVSCSRLKLIPLAYLWQRDQAELLNEMIQIGMEVILIKVAGIGLLPQHLGKTLAEMQPHLMKLVNPLLSSHTCLSRALKE